MRIRIPAGVRIDGRGYGGRFVSLDMLPVLADATDDTGRVLLVDAAARELDQISGAVEGLARKALRSRRATGRDRVRYHDAVGLQKFLTGFVDETTNTLITERRPKRKPRRERGAMPRRTPRKIDVESVGASEEFDETELVEWEIGIDYAAAGGAHRNLDVNVRIRRRDGRPFGHGEALAAMTAFRKAMRAGKSDPLPPGYQLAAIDWRRPNGGHREWKSGNKSDFETLQIVLGSAADNPNPWRLGGVVQ